MPTKASAKTTVDVVVGVDGFVAAGKPMAVRVTIKADRLIKGAVVATANDFGNIRESVVPVEVAGGATKEILLVVSSSMQNPGQAPNVRVVVSDSSGELASAEASGTIRPDQELVGVFPQMLARGKPPETAKLTVDAGTARLSPFDPAGLAVPGAVETYDMLAATTADLAGLDPTARRELLGWIGRGGRLLVQPDAAGDLPGLPAEWQPGTSRRIGAGRGEVSLLGPQGSWWDRLEPTPTRSMTEDAGVGMQMGGFPLANAVAVDAGFRAARVGWLVAFLAIYVLIAGPIAYLVLKRMKRPGLLWTVVPAVAAVFTIGATVIGRSQQHTNRAGYATLVESLPGSSWSTGSVGALAKGGSLRTTLPQGWRPATSGSPFWGGGGTTAGVRATLTKTGTEVSIATGVGQFELLTGFGPTDRAAAYVVTATSADDDSVTGTVRNTSGVALTSVAAFSGYSATSVGTLAVGEEKPFTITGVARPRGFQNGPMDDPRANIWPNINGWNGQPQLDGPVNGALWTSYLSETGANAFRLGRVVVAGWSRDEPAALRVSDVSSGRSAFVQDAPVAAVGRWTAGAIRSDVLRAPGMFGGGPNAEFVAAFTLPGDENVTRRLRLTSPLGSTTAQVWDGSTWINVTVDSNNNGFELQRSDIQNGRVYVRVNLAQLNGPFQGLVLSEVAP
jgi:hypothetical protein